MPRLERGLYERVIDEALAADLAELADGLAARRANLRASEAGDRLALHLARLIEQAVDAFDERERVEKGLTLARALAEALSAATDREALLQHAPVPQPSMLQAIVGTRMDGSLEEVEPPLVPLLDTTLLTNAPGEPRVGHQLKSETATAQRIDIVMAFIRRSGIRPFLDAFRRHCQAGRGLRILTTTYTSSTELRALEELQELGAKLRVSYDTSGTRLHAKSWLFHRGAGVSTAYVGSSNLTHSAQQTGLEWNVRISGARNPGVLQKITAVFESYWESGDFEPFVASEFAERSAAPASMTPDMQLPPTDIHPYPFQARLLEQIEVARSKGRHRNLLVSATGTGKTVMAAVDYRNLRGALDRSRLLFVTHRRELLDQSLLTYRHVLRDPNFGELWVGGERPVHFDHVFASVQSLSRADLERIDPAHFDVVVVDEFHHAKAKTYQTLLDHLRPAELLGLTATPERADGQSILDWFDGRITADLRLWDAISQQRLVPFHYYGVSDGLDLTEIPWKRGRGYDVSELTKLLTANHVHARRALDELLDKVEHPAAMRALGFCVSIDHAEFMAQQFSKWGVSCAAVHGKTPEKDRQAILARFERGEFRVLFSVDLLNEGFDSPSVDTLLLLRPTDSATLFLQQLGRGLRKAADKSYCLVLDFVGQHRREFRFDRRLRGLLGGSRRAIERQVESGFPFLPTGCQMELQPVARQVILENIRRAIPSQWAAKVAELRDLAQEGHDTLRAFLKNSGLELDDIYSGNNRSWSRLREDAGLDVAAAGPDEEALRRACGRMLHVDDSTRIAFYQEFLALEAPPTDLDPGSEEGRLVRMLVASVCDRALTKDDSLADGISLLWQHPQVRAELIELFGVLSDRVDHIHNTLPRQPGNPLRVHARYSRLEILAGFRPQSKAKVPAWQSGVYWVEEAETDLFAFTLDKTSGQFSPTTRYRDYAISPELIHWESQSRTRENDDTGRRYQEHAQRGSSIMLFAREQANDRAFWCLGPATYVRHEGEEPMAITWRLDFSLPGDLYAAFAAAVA